ncbi:MAG TPA: succinylglutamate desuccinylase/aspartoacylase family protein [Gaiellales bacterium]|jgi:hypothetical protein|nr:succinylglutamate desuccinylase/aspartoacylase family protein [Gaiellales bacterium]
MSGLRREVARGEGAVAGLEIPYFEAEGARPGPRLCLLAGVHGCEYSSIAAVVRFMRALDTGALAGSIVAVPVVNPESFRGRTPFVSPADGKNLNRCFPGDAGGTFSDALAELVFRTFVHGSDALLDLHGGDMVEALEPFALYDASAVEERSLEIARAFGLPWIVRAEPSDSPVAGTTSGAAAALGIPAVIAEVGGCGLLEQHAVEAHMRGIARVLDRLGMAQSSVAADGPQYAVDRFVWCRSEHEGWWEPAAGAGALVGRGELLGTISDLHGEQLERIESPEDGVLLFVTSSPAVAADGLLLGLGAGLSPLS